MLKLNYILWFLPLLAGAQNFKKEVLQATYNLVATQSYSVQVDYRLYLDGQTKKIFQQSNMKLSRQGSKLYYKRSEGTECLSNDNYRVTVDNTKQRINAHKITTNQKKPESDQALAYLDSMLTYCDNGKLLSSAAERVSYEFSFISKSAIEKMYVTLNKKLNLPELVRYEYREPQPIPELNNGLHKLAYEINYRNFNLNVNQNDFNEQRFFTMVAGQAKPGAGYKQYKLTLN